MSNSPNSPDDHERLELGKHRICSLCKGTGQNPAHKTQPCVRCKGRKIIAR